MYAVTSGFFPIGEISGGLVVQRTHVTPPRLLSLHARGVVEPGRLIEAASAVSGSSASAETISAVCTLHRLATFPHSSEPATIEPKNTIWCTAMPRALMKLGSIICTEAPLLAITVIQQAPIRVTTMPTTSGVIASAATSVATA